MQERNTAGLDAEQIAVIQRRDGSTGGSTVFRREADGVSAVGQPLSFGTFTEQSFIGILILACLCDGLRNGLKCCSICAGGRSESDGFHAVFAVERESLRGLRFLRGGGEKFRRRRGRRRFAGGDALSQLAVGQRSGGERRLSIQRDVAGFNGILKRGYADRLTGRRTDEQGKRIIGEIAVWRNIKRCEVLIRGQRGDKAGGGRGVRLRGGKSLANQLDDFIDGQTAARQKARDDRAVCLKLGGEYDIAAFRSGGREHRQNLCQRTRNAIGFVAQRVIKHDIAV